jgi:pimeloyl-ACP methyl ester carboxylesterase
MENPAVQRSLPLSTGQLIEVEGRSIHADKAGSGAPTIAFLPGAGLVGLDFLMIRDRATELGTSLIYDRGGTGWSDETPLPRSAEAVARELKAVLQGVGAPKPFLLVGHSLGAFYARRYAQLFPDEVGGLLLLDPGHEDIFDFMPPGAAEMNQRMKHDVAALSELTEAQLAGARAQFAQIYAAWPPTGREALIEHHLTHWRTGLAEAANMEDEIYREMREGGPLPDVPLMLLTAKGRNPYWAKFMSEEQMQTALDGVLALHASMIRSVTRGEHRTLDGASHQYLHVEQPDAIITAIADLIACTNQPP